MFNELSNGMQVDRPWTVILKLFMSKVCGIIGISKIELNKIKKCKNHSKPAKLVSQSLFKQFQQIPNIILVFY